jgi:hypothetical protein
MQGKRTFNESEMAPPEVSAPSFALDFAVIVIDGTRWSATWGGHAESGIFGFLGKERGEIARFGYSLLAILAGRPPFTPRQFFWSRDFSSELMVWLRGLLNDMLMSFAGVPK